MNSNNIVNKEYLCINYGYKEIANIYLYGKVALSLEFWVAPSFIGCIMDSTSSRVEDVLLHRMELDLDAAVVPFGISAQVFQRMEMETVAGTIRREGTLQYQHLHLSVLCSLSLVIPHAGEVCQMRRVEEMG